MSAASSQPAPHSADQPAKPAPQIIFQKYFKSVGPRTYAAQVKVATNGNHFLVLTEGKRDEKNELRKTKTSTDTYRKVAAQQSDGTLAKWEKQVDGAIAKLPDDPHEYEDPTVTWDDDPH